MSQQKVCPIMSAGAYPQRVAFCRKEECQLWVGLYNYKGEYVDGDCGLVLMVRGTGSGLADKVELIECWIAGLRNKVEEIEKNIREGKP